MLRVAYRAHDGRIFLVGMGFLSSASMLIVHYRLSTPGMLLPGCDFVSIWPPLLSIGVGGMFFALSGVELSVRANRRLMRLAGIGLLVYLIVWILYSWIFLSWAPSLSVRMPALASRSTALIRLGTYACAVGPDMLTSMWPVSLGPIAALPRLDALQLVLGIGGLGCYGFAMWRHYRLYRQSPSPAGLALTCGITLFGEALLTVLLSQPYAPSFWLYHIELAVGYSVIGYAMLRAYHHGETDERLLERLFLSGTRTRLQASYTQAMDELIATLAQAEQPSEALQRSLQCRFQLAQSQLEVLAQAAAAVAQERRQRQELLAVNSALHQLEQDKNLFIQMLVHDLKNPLAAQLGCLELLQREPLSEYQHQLLGSALWSGRNQSDLIATLLDLSRLEEGRLDLELSLVPPRDLLESCADELRSWIAEEYKTIQVEAAANLPLLQIDLRLIRRVLLNLLSNAIKHTSAGTDITIRAFPASKQDTKGALAHIEPATEATDSLQVIIEVADTGPGIPAAYLDSIFEKFVRVGGRPEGRHASTGLGLTFCRLAVETHGGTIRVSSQVGVGTTFRLELPAI
ncbi:MAG TPA: HAMP domain-containing sensor histidine kinase [Roseiflexaceae bacterium]|nr:HAMP domain-containing sensor histidine kinase [Roseiflexaceae bacterium]